MKPLGYGFERLTVEISKYVMIFGYISLKRMPGGLTHAGYWRGFTVTARWLTCQPVEISVRQQGEGLLGDLNRS